MTLEGLVEEGDTLELVSLLTSLMKDPRRPEGLATAVEIQLEAGDP